ncbi:MAG: ATP-dependent DNA helicase [Actinobacteria bacterium]|uniref:DNA 5'-3' helicase n=1 Tax=freshwater metagenome TaxID=449393 RepID=A0A6J6P572_9ZZZZ|nr:ATP-dependent DNA helicase [Actinomycetota bacterium]
MHDAFGPGGALARTLAGFESRPEQAALADAVARSLTSGEHLVAEAGTGTGKSLAYLIPSLESGERVVVATATKALQTQLLEYDVPAAARALGRKVNVEILKGRANYVCRRQLSTFGQMLLREPRDEEAWEVIEPWLEETVTGDRAELPIEPSESLWAELAVGSDRCVGRRCALLSSCFAEAARQRASEAELVIANHALYFADIAADGGVLPEHGAVVFDEAHRLEETAATWLGGRVSRHAIRRLTLDVERACRDEKQQVPARVLDRVELATDRFLAAVTPATGRRRLREPPLELVRPLVEALADLNHALAGDGEGFETLGRRSLALAATAEACLDPDTEGRVVWSEPDSVAWAPVDVATELRDRLWREGPTAILVSATLTTGEDARFVRRRLGLDQARELVVGSPFDYRSQALLYLPRGMPDPRADEFGAKVAEEVRALLQLSEGRALVLTSSYRALGELKASLQGNVPYEVLVQGEAPRERLLERFRSEVSSVLLATSTFWQGVDIPGEALSLLVIDKLPFSAPGDPLYEARCEAVSKAGGDWFADFALPMAMLQLRQGFGRLIRSHSDRGVVAILDPRLRTKAYGRAFLAALPHAPMAEDRVAVASFFGTSAVAAAGF